MHVEIVRPDQASGQADICIVIDVLRATTTATVLCHRIGKLCVVRTPADLDQLPGPPAGYALFSELTGVTSAIPRFDNSPVLARDAEIDGTTPVLVTTNGTLAIGIAAGIAREVVLASFLNLSAIVAYVGRRGATAVSIMPAGNIGKRERCIEDDACADVLAARLGGDTELDVAARIAACHADPRIVRRRANEPMLGADIELCFQLDGVSVVPLIEGGGDRRWFDVVRAG